MAERVDCIVVGAGAIGLAVARRLALDGREVVVLERAEAIGTESSSRSNEVLHAGLYYRPGGPQAVLCVAGKQAAERFCIDHGVPHARIGKLVVANGAGEEAWLRDILALGRRNGVRDLAWLDGRAAAELEPALACTAALHSPGTAIVDSHALMLAYLGDAESRGTALALRSTVLDVTPLADGFAVEVACSDDGTIRLDCATLINAAGIWATPLARRIAGFPDRLIPPIHLAKGLFFSLSGHPPFRHLIVPAPQWHLTGGIYTLDMALQARFGPDVEWVDSVDYSLDEARAAHFYGTVRRYWPGLPDGALQPGYAGIRSRLNGPGEPMADWIIQGPAEHGLPGLINLFGVESPGITASLAIAELCAALLAGSSHDAALAAVAAGAEIR